MTEIHDMPGHLIRRLNQIHASVFHDRVTAAGFSVTSVQFAAMGVLRRAPGIDQRTLAGRIAYDQATMGGVVDRLVARGYVARRVSKRDRRARELALTEAGEAALRALEPVVEALQEEILGGLDAAERATFLRLARKAAEAGNPLSRAPLVPPKGEEG
jgi:DNA-binding MarR family transcriptional regulator